MKSFLSRKFILALVFSVIVILNRKMALGLEDGDLWKIAAGFSSFILGESGVDAAGAILKAKKEATPAQ